MEVHPMPLDQDFEDEPRATDVVKTIFPVQSVAIWEVCNPCLWIKTLRMNLGNRCCEDNISCAEWSYMGSVHPMPRDQDYEDELQATDVVKTICPVQSEAI